MQTEYKGWDVPEENGWHSQFERDYSEAVAPILYTYFFT